MYSIKLSTITPYNSQRNSTFNHILLDLIKTLPKEQKTNWPLHIPSLVFAYNATPSSITGYQPYELMFRHKGPTLCNAWLELVRYNDKALTSNCVWVNEQHELLMSVNR